MRPTTLLLYSPYGLISPTRTVYRVPVCETGASPSFWSVWHRQSVSHAVGHVSLTLSVTVRAREATFTLTESNTMVKPLEKSTKFWDGHELLRLVEL